MDIEEFLELRKNTGDDRETHAIAFYEVLSSFDFVSSTPTLFNAGL